MKGQLQAKQFPYNYIVEGAKRGEKGIYVTLKEPPDLILNTAESMGLDVRKLERRNTLKLIDGSQLIYKTLDRAKRDYEGSRLVISEIANQIMREAESYGAERLAVDPLTTAIIHQ